MKVSVTTKFLLISVLTTIIPKMANAMVETLLNDKAAAAASNYNSWDGAWIVRVDHGDLQQVKKQVNAYAAQLGATATKLKVLHTFEDNEGMNALVVEGISLHEIKRMSGVIHVSPDIPVYAYEYSWGIDRSDQLNLPLDEAAYSPAFAGCGVDVYVLDTGLDTQHTEFLNGYSTSHGRVVENIWNGFGDVTDNTDGHGHGSHCAGTVGGSTVGIAPCANIYGMKVLSDGGGGSASGIIAALNEVKRRHLAAPGAKSVVSMSLGGACNGDCSDDPMVLKVQELAAVGIISSIAAGNSNADSINHTPAAAADALTVGSTSIEDGKSGFSNYGSLVDIQAPGSTITSVCTSAREGCEDSQSYWTISGTSMACPHVTGVIAQNLEKGAHVAMVDLDAVNQVRVSIMCDSAKDKISGLPVGTTKDLLQAPTDDGMWTCVAAWTADPSMEPTGPTFSPTIPPTSFPTESNPDYPEAFPAFTASDTNTATQNTINEDIFVCPGAELSFSLCSADGGSCSGDTYMRLFDESGTEVNANDDGCSLCSSIHHHFNGACQTYSLHQGCYGSIACEGRVSILNHKTEEPTMSPTPAQDVNPFPTTAPTDGEEGRIPVDYYCPSFTAGNYDDGAISSVACRVTVCPGTELTFETCDGDGKSCIGDTFLRLTDGSGNELAANDDNCGFCSRVTYEFTAPCQEYILEQGCSEGSGSCGGTTTILTHGEPTTAPIPLPTTAPIVQPTTAPTASPTHGIPNKCDAFSVSNTLSGTRNTVGCEMYVCPGEKLTMASCQGDGKACNGDTLLRLVDESGTEIAVNDDGCGYCSSISYEFTAPCQLYTLQQGCYADGSCSGESRISRATDIEVEYFRTHHDKGSK